MSKSATTEPHKSPACSDIKTQSCTFLAASREQRVEQRKQPWLFTDIIIASPLKGEQAERN